MLSDESSSESESGRFKNSSSRGRNEIRSSHSTSKDDRFKTAGRSRPDGRFDREFDRRKGEDRGRLDRSRRSRDRYEPRRYSPISRRRSSRERSQGRSRRSPEKSGASRERHYQSKPSDNINYKDRKNELNTLPTSKPLEGPHRNFKEEIKRSIVKNVTAAKSPEKTVIKLRSRSRDLTPDNKVKKSVVHRPDTALKQRSKIIYDTPKDEPEVKKASSIRSRKDSLSEDLSDLEQPAGSYYNMVPVDINSTKREDKAVSVSDSEDEEKLRAKLLNLEKELDKNKHKKHKKKTKKKRSKSKTKERDKEPASLVEVSSTTDIEKAASISTPDIHPEVAEVSSTQSKNIQIESSEEGEISSEDDDKPAEIDPTDLRHRLKRSAATVETSESPDLREKLLLKSDVSGPALPPHMDKKSRKSPSPDVEGPALPPHLCGKSRSMGPTLPADLRKRLAEDPQPVVEFESSEEDDGIGPLPAGAEEKWTAAHQRLEERALNIKISTLEGGSVHGSDVKSREQWMLELPAGKAKILGLEKRGFRAKEGPDMSDRSSWTDTPEQKACKAAGLAPVEVDNRTALLEDAHKLHIETRDADQEKAVKKHKKKHKREESLLEMHEKKMKKKKKKEEKEDGGKSRRPFDRDIDLQANRFDEAQKKSIIKKAQHLDSRFSSGEAKFL